MGALMKMRQFLHDLPTGLLENFDGLDWTQNGREQPATRLLLMESCGEDDGRINKEAIL
jgi:hypothetical protein